MDLGTEQGIPVLMAPFTPQEHNLMTTGRYIKILPNVNDGLFELTEPTRVQACFGRECVYSDLVTKFLPFFEQRLARSRSRAANRILGYYACRDGDASA
jgi:hypothetical protein